MFREVINSIDFLKAARCNYGTKKLVTKQLTSLNSFAHIVSLLNNTISRASGR